MANESPTNEPQCAESNLTLAVYGGNQVTKEKVRLLSVNRISENEISRQLAAICKLLLLALSRDFGIHSPGTVTIVPSESTRGVKLRIIGRD